MNSITDRISLTNEEIEARFAAAGCEIAIDYGDDENITVTADSLDDFRAARLGWSDRGHVTNESGDSLVIAGAQVAKGAPRRMFAVVDFGDVRLVYAP